MKKDGTPYSLAGKDITIYLKTRLEKKEVKDFSVAGNTISWTFYGKDQKHLGKHSLELVINENEVGMITTDKCGFINLVSCSCYEGGSDEGNITTESIELTTTLDEAAFWEAIAKLNEGKVDKVEGLGLSQENFTTEEKDKLSILENYDDTEIKQELTELSAEVGKKQNTITDLNAIREGASKGATALQSIPSEYVTETELTAKGYATISALNNKVDKVSGKQLSTEDFTSALKAKLEGLSNYDDTTLANAISGLETRLDTLVSGDASAAIESFNEITAFLDGVKDTQDLQGIIAAIEQQIASKQDKINDLDAIRSGAAKGATAIQKVKTINGQSIEGEGDLVIEAGGSIDPETIEGFIPLSRDFSDDFNNDFTR